MHLKTITLKNFRCFEHLEVPLHPRLTVLVAENGGGKTSVLDGIAIGLSPVLRYLSSANQRLSGPGILDTDFRLEVIEGRAGDERWVASDYAQVIVETTTGLKWDHWRASASGLQPESKTGQTELTTYAGSLLSSLKTPAPNLLPIFAYYGTSRGRIDIPERLRGESKVDYTQPTSALVGALASMSDFKEMLKWVDLEEASELRANKGNGPEDFDESPALAAIRSAISAILGGKFKNPHFNRKHKFVVEANSGPDELQVSQLSQGYQSMLALAMDFARRLALGNGHLEGLPNSYDWSFARNYIAQCHPEGLSDYAYMGSAWAPAIMLVDEIDLHLHPTWQQKVLADLMRAFPVTQFIVTTHSPQVLTTVRKENIRVIEQLPDETWQAREPVGTTPYGHSNSLSLEAVMEGDAYPPLPLRAIMREYQRLVGADEHSSPRALELRQALEKEWGKTDPELLRIDVTIRKNETLRSIRDKKS